MSLSAFIEWWANSRRVGLPLFNEVKTPFRKYIFSLRALCLELTATLLLLAPGAQAGTTTWNFTLGGSNRTALVYAPSSATNTLTPVVFVWHGHNGTAQGIKNQLPIDTKWTNAISIYPQGLPSRDSYDPNGLQTGWQFNKGDYGDRDLKFFDALMTNAKSLYKVDTNRVYCTGFSNGGYFTYLLWQQRSNAFAAFAPCSAVCFFPNTLAPLPAILLGGNNDTTVSTASQENTWTKIRGVDHCATNSTPWPDTVSDPLYGIADYYASEPAGTPVVIYEFSGGHQIIANEPTLIVDFFQNPLMVAGPGAYLTKANNNLDLTNGASWVGGVAPATNQWSTWDATVATAANCTNNWGSNPVIGGIKLLNPATHVYLTSSVNFMNLVGIGGVGVDASQATVDLTFQGFGPTIPSSQTWSNAANHTVTVNGGAALVNSSILTFAGPGAYVFTGGFNVANARTLYLVKNGPGALTLSAISDPKATTGLVTLNAGTLNLNNAVALGGSATNATGKPNPVTFEINGGTLDNTSGGPLTLTNNPMIWNGNFSFTGSTNLNLGNGAVALTNGNVQVTASANTLEVDGVISDITNGVSAGYGLTKLGAGALVLGGANTYTGNTTVNGGTLALQQPALFTNSTVTVASSGVLALNFGVTNQVSALVLNGVSQPSGVYNSGTPGGYLAGAGSLQVGGSVVALKTNAFLTSLVLTPAGALVPGFATNTFNYWVTNMLPNRAVTVTVTNADLTATNTLIYNGAAQGTLASGAPSASLLLSQGVTNAVRVLVLAQDGVATNRYTVNVTLQPNQGACKLTNSVSGGTNLVLNWPADHTGYRLLVQTNHLSDGVSGNPNDWGAVPGSAATNTLSLPILRTNVSQYYQLVYP